MDILKTIYTDIWSLQEWVEQMVSQQTSIPSQVILNDASDPESNQTFLEKTVVAVDKNYKLLTHPISLSQNSHQREIVLRVIERIHRREGAGQNMLTLGFGPMSDDPDAYISNLPNLEYRYPNNCVNRLHYGQWKKLLTRIGDTLMEHLLEHTAVFMFVPPSCYIQMTGKPVYELWPLKPALSLSIPDSAEPKLGKKILIEKMTQKARKKEPKQGRNSGAVHYKNFKELKESLLLSSSTTLELHHADFPSASAVSPKQTVSFLHHSKHTPDSDESYLSLKLKAMEYANQNVLKPVREETSEWEVKPSDELNASCSSASGEFCTHTVGSITSSKRPCASNETYTHSKLKATKKLSKPMDIETSTAVPGADKLKHVDELNVSSTSASGSAEFFSQAIGSGLHQKHYVDPDDFFEQLKKSMELQKCMEYTGENVPQPIQELRGSQLPTVSESDKNSGQSSVKMSASTNLSRKRSFSEVESDDVKRLTKKCKGGSPYKSRKQKAKERRKIRLQKNLLKKGNNQGKNKKRKKTSENLELVTSSQNNSNSVEMEGEEMDLDAVSMKTKRPRADVLCDDSEEDIFAERPQEYWDRKSEKDSEKRTLENTRGRHNLKTDEEALLGKPFLYHTYFNRKNLMCCRTTREKFPVTNILSTTPATRDGALSLYKTILQDDTVLPEVTTKVCVTIQYPQSLDSPVEPVTGQTATVAQGTRSNTRQSSSVVHDTGSDMSRRRRRSKFQPRKQKKAHGATIQQNALAQMYEIKPDIEFNLVSQTGPPHAPTFVMSLEVDGTVFEGQGGSKKLAKLRAAENALRLYQFQNTEYGITQQNAVTTDDPHNQDTGVFNEPMTTDQSQGVKEERQEVDIAGPSTMLSDASISPEGSDVRKHKNIEFVKELIPVLQKLLKAHKEFLYRRELDDCISGTERNFRRRTAKRGHPKTFSKNINESTSVVKGPFSVTKTPSAIHQCIVKRKPSVVKGKLRHDDSQVVRSPRLDGAIIKRGSTSGRGISLLTRLLRRNRSKKVTITKLLSQYVPHSQVSWFVKKIIFQVMMPSLLGDRQNCKELSKKMETFVSMGKFDKYCLGQLMNDLEMKHIKWLHKVESRWVRLHLLAKVLYWVMHQLIMTALKTFFYITESTVCRNRLFYYRKSVWQRLQTRGIQDLLKSKRIEKITETTALKQLGEGTALGVASVRFIPKSKSLRTIVNLGKEPPPGSRQTIAVNKQLLNLFQILMYHKNKNQELTGAAKFGTDEIYTAWKDFVQTRNGCEDQLYFVKLDISSCFDCINKDKLMEIVEQIFRDDEVEEYIVRRYVSIVKARGQLCRRFHRKASTLEDFDPDFTTFVKKMAEEENSRNIVLSDKVVNQHEHVSSLLEQLKNHLNHNIMKIGRQYFVQKQGISQGSVLSTILCNLYCGHLENSLFPVQDDELLMRMVDDSLFVTPCKERAVDFLTKMIQGVPDYNFEVNTDKVLVNFDHTNDKGVPLPRISSDWFPFCGMLFNTRRLHVGMDLSRYAGLNIADTMSIDVAYKPGETMKKKLMFFLRPKNQVIYLDTQLNSPEVVITNCSKMFILTAMKFHCYNMHLPVKQRVIRNVKYFTEMVLDLANYLYSQVVCVLQQKNPGQKICTVPQHYIQWICLHSFLLKLQGHKPNYKKFIKTLKQLRAVTANQLNKKEPGVEEVLLKLCDSKLPEEWNDILH